MRSKQSFVIALAVILLVTGFQNCQPTSSPAQGTETGNSLAPAPISGPQSSPDTSSATLVSAICVELNGCDSAVSISQCEATLFSQVALPQRFGVPQSSGLTTMQELSAAERAGQLSASSFVSACENEIKVTSCAGPGMSSGYSETSNSYPGLSTILSYAVDCQKVY